MRKIIWNLQEKILVLLLFTMIVLTHCGVTFLSYDIVSLHCRDPEGGSFCALVQSVSG